MGQGPPGQLHISGLQRPIRHLESRINDPGLHVVDRLRRRMPRLPQQLVLEQGYLAALVETMYTVGVYTHLTPNHTTDNEIDISAS